MQFFSFGTQAIGLAQKKRATKQLIPKPFVNFIERIETGLYNLIPRQTRKFSEIKNKLRLYFYFQTNNIFNIFLLSVKTIIFRILLCK